MTTEIPNHEASGDTFNASNKLYQKTMEHLETATKYYLEASLYHEAGDHLNSEKSTGLAHEQLNLAIEVQRAHIKSNFNNDNKNS